LLKNYQAFLPTLFIVSQVELASELIPDSPSTELLDLRVRVEEAAGGKCERCWNYSPRVGEDARYPTVCERCVAALEEIARSA
jgi:isoleucyl-tRNA synthetase